MLATRLAVLLCLAAFPAFAQLSVHGQLVYDNAVQPGGRYAGSFLVRNDSDTPRDVLVQQHDFKLESDTVALVTPPATHRRSNAGWVVVTPSRFTVAPGETQRVDYEIAVPRDIKGAPPEGSYRSLIAVSELPAETSHRRMYSLIADAGVPVSDRDVRQSVQIATHIAGTGVTDLTFLGVDVRDENGMHVMTADVENTGDVVIEPSIWVELYSASGDLVERRQAEPTRLYPGDSLRHRLPLDTLGAGIYEALIVVDAGGDNIFGAQYTLDLNTW
ncbi:MAG: hypothetical protein R2834_18780 [Rhodothermales bacterium]